MNHILHGLKITEEEAVHKEVATYLAAERTAKQFNERLSEGMKETWTIHFVAPLVFVLNGKAFFGEQYVPGRFVKWNNNTGEVNLQADATADQMHQVTGVLPLHISTQ